MRNVFLLYFSKLNKDR